tara:strand:+ start:4705 stop:5205 length:501 start_codon:yes stop_codon:yes gene_type:complete
MKNFLLSVVIYLATITYAQSQIAYIDMELILNQSFIGKKYTDKLDVNKKRLLETIKKDEKLLLNEKKLLITQKNVLNEEDYNTKLKLLKIKVNDHNNLKKNRLDDLRNKSFDMTAKLLKLINPIIEKYASKNSISILLQKKNIVIGDTNLDITPKILELVNQTVKE